MPSSGLKSAAFTVASLILGAGLTIRPALADYASDRVLCHTFESGEREAKVAACTRVLATGRLSGFELAIAYQDRAEGYRLLEQYDDALADYDRSIKIDPNISYSHLNRAELHRLKGNYEKAIEDATIAIRIDPALNASYAIRGFAYEKLGQVAEARADFNKALAIPIKGNDGEWAQNVAREELKNLEGK